MKNPLHYQLSEYDCGPTSLLNAISYLFERETIPPEVIRNIMVYSLDVCGADGCAGKNGTSPIAMMFLSNWLNSFAATGQFPVSSQYLSGEAVNFAPDSKLRDALRRGGAAVARVDFDIWHYVLLTGIQDDQVFLFDPYYRETPFPGEQIQMISDHPTAYNRIAPASYFDREALEVYAFGPLASREAVLIFNEQTKLTEENTLEYMI